MRVVAGKYRGHQLVSFDADHIRPTTDRIKESLFNIIQLYFNEDTIFADCYSGTGSLGIEALSRGAKFVNFIDNNKRSIQILKKNFQKLKIPNSEYRVINSDVIDYFNKFDLSEIGVFLIDPPFTKKIANTSMLALSNNQSLLNGSIIAIESFSNELINDHYKKIKLIRQKKFNDKLLSIFQVCDIG